jgi:phosphoglucosamine mutase
MKGNVVIATVMSNIGLERYLNSIDLSLIRTDVGDKNVMSSMIKEGSNIGGEQSGHIILSDYSTTGDGLIAALQVLSVIVEKGEKASKVLNLFESVPQILVNIDYEGESPLDRPEIIKIIKDKETELADNGRILVRKSGTEKLIRIMVEGDDYSIIELIADEIAQHIHGVR